jgi:hypothetical protein
MIPMRDPSVQITKNFELGSFVKFVAFALFFVLSFSKFSSRWPVDEIF